MDQINKLSDEEYYMHCIKCLTQDKLTMHPHRRDGKIVGFVYICIKCEEDVNGKEIHLDF